MDSEDQGVMSEVKIEIDVAEEPPIYTARQGEQG